MTLRHQRLLAGYTRCGIASASACAVAALSLLSMQIAEAVSAWPSPRFPTSMNAWYQHGAGGGGVYIGDGSMGDDETTPPGGDVGNDDGDDIDYDDPSDPNDPPPWPGDDESDEDEPGSGIGGGSGGGGGGSGSGPPSGGGGPPSGYTGFLWGGSSEVFLNGIGTPDNSWKNDLIRPGDTAGPLTASPDRSVMPATGASLEEVTDLVIDLPGRDFVLTRNFTGRSDLMRRGSFGPLTVGGWTLSTDAYVFADLIKPLPPVSFKAVDTWRRMGIVLLIQSPLRTTIGFHNFLNYKPESVWYDAAYSDSADGGVFPVPSPALTAEQFREFRPMGPGLCRVVADKLTYRHPYFGNTSNVTLPVWKVVEPGKGTSYFFRKCETTSANCVNMAKESGEFDAGAGYDSTLLASVPAGKLWCQFDEFGNAWTYEYKLFDTTSGTTNRLVTIYFHGISSADAIGRVRFEWGLSKNLDDEVIGTWRVTRAYAERPYVPAGGSREWVTTDFVEYTYRADAHIRLDAIMPGIDPLWLSSGGIPDDLVMAIKRTAVNLPMSEEPREGMSEDEYPWTSQVSLYRYAIYEGPTSQLKAVFGPSSLDVMTRENWKITAGEGTGSKLWERGLVIRPGLFSHVEATAWALLSLGDTDEIAPADGTGTGPAVKVWHAADRWTTYYGVPRTIPTDTGSPDPTADFGQFKGRVMTEFSKPAGGGPTLRRDFEYSSKEEDLTDAKGVKRKSRVWGNGVSTPTPFNQSYILRSTVQRTTERTRRTDTSLPSSGTLWDIAEWEPRRRITNRSEERELLSIVFEQRIGTGSSPSIHVQSLVSAVPFTVAELVEDISTLPGPSPRRHWLTVHYFDKFNRPVRTVDPGAFQEAEYPADDTAGTFGIECRLTDWEAWANANANKRYIGSAGTTIYQDHDPSAGSDPAGPTSTFLTFINSGTSSWPSDASKNFLHNYPSTTRASKQYAGWYPEASTSAPFKWRLLTAQRHAGTLGFFGQFSYGSEPVARPDLLLAEYRCRDGEDVDITLIDDTANQPKFERSSYAYTTASTALVNQRIGYPAVNTVAMTRELEAADENGSGGDEVTVLYLDPQGRTSARVSPSGVSTAFVYSAAGTGLDTTGRAVEVHEDVTLTVAGGYVTGFSDNTDALVVKARYDVAGNKLSDTSADGVQRSLHYAILADTEASPSVYTVRLARLPVALSGKFSGPAACQWLNSAGQPIRVVGVKPLSIDLDAGSGAVIAWEADQELSRSETDYVLSGLAVRDRSWAFASVEGVFPTSVPDQVGSRSAPYASSQVQDGDGNVVEAVDALGNITRNAFDARSRLIQVRKTVVGASTDWLVEERFYDKEDAARLTHGDGLLTRVVSYIDGGADEETARQTKNWYDYRNRLIMTAPVTVWEAPEVPAGPLSITLLDNLDRATVKATLHQGAIGITDWANAAEGDVVGCSLATAVQTTAYSQRGLAYRSRTLLQRGPELWSETNHWFDNDGRELASRTQGRPTVRRSFDAHGRVMVEAQYATVPPSDRATAINISNGFMLSRTANTYHSGRAALGLVTTSQRTHTSVPAGSVTDDVFTPSDTSKCVTTYSAPVYDSAGRVIANVNYGTRNSAGFTSIGAPSAPGLLSFGQSDNPSTAIPGLSGDALVFRTEFNDFGLVGRTSRARDGTGAREDTRVYYDSLGRTIATIENATSAAPAPSALQWSTSSGGRWTNTASPGTASLDENRLTTKAYDASGNVVRQIAHLRDSGGAEKVQVTGSRYQWDPSLDGASTDTPSPTARHGLLYEVNYPATSGATIGEVSNAAVDSVRFGYNLLGEQTTSKDQAGTVHAYTRDAAGRLISDRVAAFGATAASASDQHVSSTVDSTVSQIITKYDGYGKTAAVVSCDTTVDPTGTVEDILSEFSVKNYVEYVYQEPLGELVELRQSAEGPGPVDSDTRYRSVRRTYSIQTEGGLAWHRLASTTYPDPTAATGDETVLEVDYGLAVDASAGRATGLKLDGGTTPIAKYARVGLGTVAVTDFPLVGVQLDRTVDPAGTRDYDPAGGAVSHSSYGGWDRYGRVARNSWVTSDFGSGYKPLWQEVYEYDLLTRRMSKDSTRGVYDYKDEDWKYTYDGLDRVIKSERGVLSGGAITTPSTGLPVKEWTLDELGNWKQFKSKRPPTLTQTENRDHTAANELKNINAAYRFYDANGNLVRIATSIDGSTGTIQSLSYDAWNRLVHISKLRSGTDFDVVDYSYNGLNWCVREVRNSGDPSVTDDEWRWRFYSPQWQLLTEARATSSSGSPPGSFTPGTVEEQFWGLRGTDDAILRRCDTNGDHAYAASGEFAYYQLTDVSFSVIGHIDADSGAVRQWMSYDVQGNPKILRTGDWNGDGNVTTADQTGFTAAYSTVPPSSDADVNGDGVVDAVDSADFASMYSGSLSIPADEVRIGFAGYVRDPLVKNYLARNRWYEPSAGRWLTRDPAGYVDGLSLYLYVKGNPLSLVDPTGLRADGVDLKMRRLEKQINEKGTFKGVVPGYETAGKAIEALADAGDAIGAAIDTPTGRRVMGGLQLVGGIAESAAGLVGGIVSSPTIGGAILGGGVALHGIDNIQSGTRQLWTGQPTRTLTNTAATGVAVQLGASPQLANQIGNAVDFGAGLLGPGALSKASKFSGTESSVARYVTQGEALVAERTGFIPNTNVAGNPKVVFVTPDAPLFSASQAEKAYQIGRYNPGGAGASPTHVIIGDARGVQFDYGGLVDGGSGVEMITSQRIPVKTIKPLK